MNADDTFGEYAVHPVADIFPMMGDDELDTLADDIEANGLREPIQIGLLSDESQVWVLIDGRNRYRACMKAGVTPSVDRNQMDPDKIAAWILSHNLHRRHLTTSQRAAIAVDLEPALAELAAQRMRAGVKADPVPNSEQGEVGRAVEQAASMVGVGKSSVQDAKYVAQKDPDTFERIRAGAVTASRAARDLRQGEVKRRRPLDNDIRNLATALTKITGQLERLAKDDRLHDHEELFRGLVAVQLDTIADRYQRVVSNAAAEPVEWNEENDPLPPTEFHCNGDDGWNKGIRELRHLLSNLQDCRMNNRRRAELRSILQRHLDYLDRGTLPD